MTVVGGAMVLPAIVPVGCCPNASLAAGPAATVIVVLPTLPVAATSLTPSVWEPAVFSVTAGNVCDPASLPTNV